MMKINKHELDRHITGNFGEDAFAQDEDDDVCTHCANVYIVFGDGTDAYVVCSHADSCPVTSEEDATVVRRLLKGQEMSNKNNTLDVIAQDVIAEYLRARRRHEIMHSTHEGISVIRE
ncbi:hypothetical protein LCGC14_0711190, partial [marine sediment metagenome]